MKKEQKQPLQLESSLKLESAPKTFTCDHPFGFMIVENKFGSVLFEGLVADPTIGVEAKTE